MQYAIRSRRPCVVRVGQRFFPPSVSPRRIRPVRTVTRSVRAAACHCGRHNLSAAVRTYHQPLFCGLTVQKNPKEKIYDKRGKSSDNRNKRDRQSVFRAGHTFCHKRGFRSFRAKAKIRMGRVYPIFRSSARFPLKIRRTKEEKQKIPPHKKHRHRPFLDGCGHSSFNFISLCFLKQSQSDTLRFCSFLFPNKHRRNSSILFCCVF